METISKIVSALLKAPLALLLIGVILFWVIRSLLPLRIGSEGFKYVCVEDDKTVRELKDDEIEYLNTKFHGADSGRPYIKSSFWSKTPDKKMGGYIRRSKVPWWIEIKKNYTQQG